ncbi:MAG: choice-of-anchor tandem repeat GloVer-containing protein [Candidatus Sulfotelmatobacter sp.]
MKIVRLSPLALAVVAFSFSLAVCAQAQNFSYLAAFDGTNGYQPFGALTQATDGNIYGTTTNGGGHGYGNVYRITPNGEITSIYDFCKRPNCADGTTPEWAPVLGSDGNLYGTTTGIDYGYGTVYKMALSGELTTLYTFCSLANCADGSTPNGLVAASDGNFYGTTFGGGNFNAGTIFKITPSGQFTSLYSFCSLANCADGNSPVSPLIVGSDGNLYGAAWQYNGGGVLYRFTLAGDYKALYSFCRGIFCTSGSGPLALVQDANGNFFGTTQYGGSKGDYGTVFELTAKQQFINLHNFDKTDGAYPDEGLTLGNDGNFYGITAEGGPANAGTIFEITTAGEFKTLYTFAPPYGDEPAGPLLQATDGNLYGTTPGGPGDDPLGTVFEFSNGLSPSVKPAPGVGKVGKTVLILGNNLTGSTSVMFNGVEAKFTVESDTYIKATVPAGATTGVVSVVTPSGTLNSNPQFVVTK